MNKPYFKDVSKDDWIQEGKEYKYILNVTLDNPILETTNIQLFFQDEYGKAINLDMKIIDKNNIVFYNKSPIDMSIWYQEKQYITNEEFNKKS